MLGRLGHLVLGVLVGREWIGLLVARPSLGLLLVGGAILPSWAWSETGEIWMGRGKEWLCVGGHAGLVARSCGLLVLGELCMTGVRVLGGLVPVCVGLVLVVRCDRRLLCGFPGSNVFGASWASKDAVSGSGVLGWHCGQGLDDRAVVCMGFV